MGKLDRILEGFEKVRPQRLGVGNFPPFPRNWASRVRGLGNFPLNFPLFPNWASSLRVSVAMETVKFLCLNRPLVPTDTPNSLVAAILSKNLLRQHFICKTNVIRGMQEMQVFE